MGENIWKQRDQQGLGFQNIQTAHIAQHQKKHNPIKKQTEDLIRLYPNKDFCASKDTIKKVKRQPTEQEKIFVNHISDKRLASRVYKEHLKVNYKKKTQF